MMKCQKLLSLGAVFLMLLITSASQADIREKRYRDFPLSETVNHGCKFSIGSPSYNERWRYEARYAPPKNFGFGLNLTWEFVSVWFVHFNTLHERLKHLHVTDVEMEWIKQRRKDLTTENGLYILDSDAWEEYQTSWQMRKWRVSSYIHSNLATLQFALNNIESGGSRALLYGALKKWSADLDHRLPPYDDLHFFVANGHMKPLTQRRESSKGVGPFLGYEEGFIPTFEFEIDTLEYRSEVADQDGNVEIFKRPYERVHEFVSECIAKSLMEDYMR